MSEPRFDVVYDLLGCNIDYHFCREWDKDGGCYGTNPNHGFTFEEAKAAVIDFHLNRVKEWRALTLEDWEKYNAS